VNGIDSSALLYNGHQIEWRISGLKCNMDRKTLLCNKFILKVGRNKKMIILQLNKNYRYKDNTD
jgi:hypothetical protein